MTFPIALGSVTAKSPANCSILRLNVYLDTCASVALTNALFYLLCYNTLIAFD